MGGRAVECTGLEIRRSCKRSVGSNPTPSASKAFPKGPQRTQSARRDFQLLCTFRDLLYPDRSRWVPLQAKPVSGYRSGYGQFGGRFEGGEMPRPCDLLTDVACKRAKPGKHF